MRLLASPLVNVQKKDEKVHASDVAVAYIVSSSSRSANSTELFEAHSSRNCPSRHIQTRRNTLPCECHEGGLAMTCMTLTSKSREPTILTVPSSNALAATLRC